MATKKWSSSMTKKQDKAWDKKKGIKQGSKADKRRDSKLKVNKKKK